MALITCADCGQKVSAMAAACPRCGRPMRDKFNFRYDPPEVRSVPRGTRTIEATGKGWKFLQLVGVLLTIGGGVTTCVKMQMPHPPGADATFGLAVLGFAVGLLIFIAGRIGAWWFHG
ncbi:hypothetical protein LLG95_12910 [bacterium]|nr:hypothetical protein [bacterium]